MPGSATRRPRFGKIIFALWLTFFLGLCAKTPLPGQAFDSGSNGSYGALNVTTNTILDMPADGIFHCTTISVASGTTLRFKGNPLNTPVYLLATGDINIQGTIDVSGSAGIINQRGVGGPGGFDGGIGSTTTQPHGEGQGPGGGKAGQHGVFGLPAGSNSNVYGNSLLLPLLGGSGGGGYTLYAPYGAGGGGGGGAILISSSTKVKVNGSVLARGGNGGNNQGYSGGDGSGGAIRIVAPSVEGSGSLFANSNQGGDGRVRIDCPDLGRYAALYIYGRLARGRNMVVFPPGNPRLDIVSAAGIALPEGTNATVSISLPAGSSTNQLVRVQARNFTNDVPIRVKVIPDFGPSSTFDGVILQSSGNPPYADVNVTIVPDMVCYIHAWTR
jgi:hypothetical protein